MSIDSSVLEHRREVRVQAELDGAFLLHAPNRPESVRVHNVSLRGARLDGLRRPLHMYSEYVLMLQETPFRLRCCWSRPGRYQAGFVAGCVVVNGQEWPEFLQAKCNVDVVRTRQRRSSIRIVRSYRVRCKTEQGVQAGWTRNFSRHGASLALPSEVAAGAQGSVIMRIPPQPIEAATEVVRCTVESDGSWAVAVRFTALAPAHERELTRQISRLKQDWAEGAAD